MSGLMTSKEAAAYLGVSESTLSRWRTYREGPPFVNLGGLKPIPRYRLEHLDTYISEKTVSYK